MWNMWPWRHLSVDRKLVFLNKSAVNLVVVVNFASSSHRRRRPGRSKQKWPRTAQQDLWAVDIGLVSFNMTYSQRRQLKSSTTRAAAVRRARTQFGKRTFSVSGPRVWNIYSLPIAHRNIGSYPHGRRHRGGRGSYPPVPYALHPAAPWPPVVVRKNYVPSRPFPSIVAAWSLCKNPRNVSKHCTVNADFYFRSLTAKAPAVLVYLIVEVR